ncbi:MAG: amino acid permease [Bacteroidaceae bacterium]|nr:amino acid permease [Bacteroidaceae bacterium]
MGLFIRKPLDLLQREAEEEGSRSLKRVLGPVSLIAMGVGVIVGAGLFSITGLVAANYAGPAITLSFVIAAVCCCFAGLCYAEFSSMIPVAGSAYTYSYATMGELVAWIIGWDLVLEYSVAATTVSISWSRYVVSFFDSMGIALPHSLTACPWDGGTVNVPAFLIVVLMSLFLIRGTKESSLFNSIIVFLKVTVIILFIVLGWKYVNNDNFHPYIPANTGSFGSFGLSGVFRGAAIVFFAFLGFDSVSTMAQETRNPKRNMPIGILGSLIVVLILYLGFSYVMTGVANYTLFSGQDGIAPVAVAIRQMGAAGADGVVTPAYPWLNRAILLAILVGYCSVIMVTLFAQSRIFLSMSRDGLLPPFFSKIHPRFRTPAHSNALFMIAVGLLAAFVPAEVAGEMTSIGTLFAFILVCAGVLIIRKTMTHNEEAFRVPFVPAVPILGIVTCFIIMISLPPDTWIRLIVWMLIGLDIYLLYGIRNSHLESIAQRRGQGILNTIGLCISVLCCLSGLWHQHAAGWESSKFLLVTALFFGLLHMAVYLYRIYK